MKSRTSTRLEMRGWPLGVAIAWVAWVASGCGGEQSRSATAREATAATAAHTETPRETTAPSGPVATKVTDGVYVVHGPVEYPNKRNKGFMNNPGFVVTKVGVVVVDPGGSSEVGEMLLAKIKEQSAQDVVAIFNTHIHGDHWLGNGAIKKAYPNAVVYAHPEMKAALDAGAGEQWLKEVTRLTEGTLPPTTLVAPDKTISDGVLEIGGLHFRVHHTGPAHTKGDLMVEVVERKTVFLGDNAANHRILRLDDGSFKGNIAALEHAVATGAQYFVPGHGASGGPEVVKNYRDYMAAVRAGVEAHFAQGLQDYEMKPKIDPSMSPWKGWYGFDTEFGKHVSLCYHEVELEKF